MKAWPWLLILDGFDEVASAYGRDTVMDQLSNFMGEVEADDADVFVLATSRPQGYAGEFAQFDYRSFELAPLEAARAVQYGLKLADARLGDDPDVREQVAERLNVASNDRRTARLMRSPLQVTIMSILLEARERVPRARYELFEAYYDAIYARESTKPGALGKLLEKRRADVNAIHNWLGLLLQHSSEQAGGLDASIPHEQLRSFALSRLEQEGYDRSEAAALSDELVSAVTERLVLIVPTKFADVGFEVRSIQEFFAARAIVSGSDGLVLDRLAAIIEPVHWRNTWLFAAGKTFLEREHIRKEVVGLLGEIDNRDLLRMVVAPGADLALDLLEDDVASSSPRLQRTIFRQALELLKYPPDTDLRRRSPVLFQMAETDTYLAHLLEESFDQAVRGNLAQRDSAHAVLELADRRATQLAMSLRPRLREVERLHAESAEMSGDESGLVSDILTTALDRSSLSDGDRKLVSDLIPKIAAASALFSSVRSDAQEPVSEDEVPTDSLEVGLAREPVGNFLASATIAAAREYPNGSAVLRNLLRSRLQRRPGGVQISNLTVD